MDHAVLIASFLGPSLIVIATAMPTNRRALEALAGQMPDNLAVIFLAGLLLLLAGLAILRLHNEWSDGWPVIITLFGWLAVIGGIVRMIIPDQSAALATQLVDHRPLVVASGVVLLGLGVFLTAKGYGLF